MIAFHVRSMTRQGIFALLWLGFALVAIIMLLPHQARAQSGQGQANHIAAKLVAESASVSPGRKVLLAFAMTPAKGWHGYWENPGDAGIGMTVNWTLPPGVKAGSLRYPVPETLMISGIMNYVYEGPYAVLVPFTIDKSVAMGTRLPITAKADWLACTDEICVPERATLSIMLVAGDASATPTMQKRFAGYMEQLPAPLGSEARFSSANDRFRISIPFPAASPLSKPYFFALTDGVVDYGAPQKVFRDGDRLVIETRARGAGPDTIEGLLKIAPHRGLSLTAKRGKVAAGVKPFAGGADDEAGAGPSEGTLLLFVAALGGAILGGLLLNVMPCVFPILSLKAISLAKAGGDERAARRDALAYTAGIMLTCVALGAALIGLRAAGEQIGWAFQLQDPRIILILLLLVTAIAFNLAGLFEVSSISAGGSLAAQGGAKGAFWTGALAAFVATPCTAPFMAGAMGTALILPVAAALVVFAGLGLGLALPFLLLGFVPPLRRRLPKPGAWMETFRRVMAVPMFLTALALAWLLAQQIGADGMLIGLAATMALALFLWWYGIRQRSYAPMVWMPLVPALAAGVIGLVLLPQTVAVGAGGADGSTKSADSRILPSEPYSAERLAALRSEGRPVFAYFTADWCITCKANEAAAVQREATAQAFAKADVAVLEGDWTRQDAEITRYLEDHGRSGVPLYVYYAPGQDARHRPQLLTVTTLTDLVS